MDVISEPTIQWMKHFTIMVSGWYHPKCFRNRDSFSWENHFFLSSQSLFWKGLTISPFWSPVLKSYDPHREISLIMFFTSEITKTNQKSCWVICSERRNKFTTLKFWRSQDKISWFIFNSFPKLMRGLYSKILNI